MFEHSLFIFRRDLRLIDNTALIQAIKNSKSVSVAFILDPRQVEDNPYRSIPGMQFLFESLTELNHELKLVGSNLNLFYGNPVEVLSSIFNDKKISPVKAVFINRDYTPFSNKRDEEIYKLCAENSVNFFAAHDTLLVEPLKTLKPDGKPYTVFTPFFKKNSKTEINKPSIEFDYSKLSKSKLNNTVDVNIFDNLLPERNPDLFTNGGRKIGLSLVQEKIKNLIKYNDDRDIPSIDGTSGLSAHHKFGTVSIRESYWAAKENLDSSNNFINELFWRDFATSIGYFFPHVYGNSFQPKFQGLEWDDSIEKFQAWCNGNTGFPIVDAGMRQLNTTGWMHNRVRMIVASFLIKDLHIDWRWGEKYFAQKLIDYDPAVNNTSWQWAASTGCDAQPYFRIFNPKLQQEKFDKDCFYIKKWVLELADYTTNQIHGFEDVKLGSYRTPIVVHSVEKKITEERYNKAAKRST